MVNQKFLFTRIEVDEDDYLVDLSEGGVSESLSCAAEEYLDEMEEINYQVRQLENPVYWH